MFKRTSIPGTALHKIIMEQKFSDLRFCKELTEQGRFYEYVMKKFGINEERSLFKVRFFRYILYNKENENEEREKFNKLFPSVSEIISH